MKGVYVIVLEAEKPDMFRVGRRLSIEFKEGFYGYVGSALSGLEHRIKRHIGSSKKFHWHIDYLTGRAKMVNVIFSETPENKECLIAQILNSQLTGIKYFGCSDCRCDSNLFFSRNYMELVNKITSAFRETGLFPCNWPTFKAIDDELFMP